MFEVILNFAEEYKSVLLILFVLLAFTETVAIVGVVIPGVVVMTGLAVIAANSDIPLVLTLFAAFIGTLLGDIISYKIGQRFANRITKLKMYDSSVGYFNKYGTLSLAIGKFIGPLRPMLPLIAGTLNFPKKKAYKISFITSPLWAIVYVVPSYYLGISLATLETGKIYTLVTLVLIMLTLPFALREIAHQLDKRIKMSLNVSKVDKSKKVKKIQLGLLVNSAICFVLLTVLLALPEKYKLWLNSVASPYSGNSFLLDTLLIVISIGVWYVLFKINNFIIRTTGHNCYLLSTGIATAVSCALLALIFTSFGSEVTFFASLSFISLFLLLVVLYYACTAAEIFTSKNVVFSFMVVGVCLLGLIYLTFGLLSATTIFTLSLAMSLTGIEYSMSLRLLANNKQFQSKVANLWTKRSSRK